MMKPNPSSPCRHAARRERGIVVFVALIAMVVLSLAAVALIRAVDTNISVAGSLAFRQAANALINSAVEKATADIFVTQLITDTTNDDLNHNYYATIQAGEKSNGVPAVLQGNSPSPTLYPATFQTIADNAARTDSQNQARWVIERLCSVTGDPLINIGKCDVMVPKVSPGKTTMKGGGPPTPPQPMYRVTIRVDGPGNTVAYAQAMLR